MTRAGRAPDFSAAAARLVPPALVFCATFLAFLPSLANGFVNWDDSANFLNNHRFRGLSLSHLGWMWTTLHMGHYIPLTWMSLGLDYVVWGMNPLGYHLTNLLIHSLNAVALYCLARLVFMRAVPSLDPSRVRAASVFSALFFSVHPLRVESVAWVTERRDVLSCLFFILTLIWYLKSRGGPPEAAVRRKMISLGLFAVSLLAKVTPLTLPVVLLVLDVYPLKRLRLLPGASGMRLLRAAFREKLLFFLFSLVAAWGAVYATALIDQFPPLEVYGFGVRAARVFFSLAFFPTKTVFPANLSILYDYPFSIDPAGLPYVFAGAATLLLGSAAVLLRGRWPAVPAALASYAVLLSPTLIAASQSVTNDRYGYLPCVGLSLFAGSVLATSRPGRLLLWAQVAGGAFLLFIGALTWRQCRVWKDSETLWGHAISVAPDRFLAHHTLGLFLAGRKDYLGAEERLRRSLEIKENYPPAQWALGRVLVFLGRDEEALRYFQRASQLYPKGKAPLVRRGHAMMEAERWADAAADFREQLKGKPEDFDARHHLAYALMQMGRLKEAEESYYEAIRIDGSGSLVHNNMGTLKLLRGKPAEAAESFRRALELNPDLSEAHNNMGKARAQLEDKEGAYFSFRRALSLQPDFAEAHFNLGLLLSYDGRYGEALAYYRKAEALRPGLPGLAPYLSEALRKAGGAGEVPAKSSGKIP